MILFLQPSTLQAIGWAVVNSFWQLALLWLIYSLFIRIFPSANSGVRSGFASLLLISGFGWFLVTLFSSINSSFGEQSLLIAVFENYTAFNSVLSYLFPGIAWLYIFFLFFRVYHFFRSWSYVHDLRKKDLIKPGIDWKLYTKHTASLLGIHKNVSIWLSEYIATPVTLGFFKPIILIPASLVTQLTTAQLEAVILHELAHIRRKDFLINLVLKFISTFLYFNPLTRFFIREIEQEREKSCDQLVLQFQYDPYAYASALLTVEKINREADLVLAASGPAKSQLLQRVETILSVNSNTSWSVKKVLGSLASFLFFGILVFSFSSEKQPEQIFAKTNFITVNPLPEPAVLSYEDELSQLDETKKSSQKTNKRIAETKVENSVTESLIEIAAEDLEEATLPVFQVGFTEQIIPELEEKEEAQVSQALASSRIILKDMKQRIVENSNDLNNEEKYFLKEMIDTTTMNPDWHQLSEKLRINYEIIDWEKANASLNQTVALIEANRIERSILNYIREIDELIKLLDQHKLSEIPDTDISKVSLAKKRTSLLEKQKSLKLKRQKEILRF